MGLLNRFFGKLKEHSQDFFTEQQVKKMMNMQVDKMKKLFKGRPGFRDTEKQLNEVFQVSVIEKIKAIVSKGFAKSISDKQHYWRTLFVEDLLIAVSIIPTSVPEMPNPQHFNCEYMKFINILLNDSRVTPGRTCIIHWVFLCVEEGIYGVDVTILPRQGLAIIAQDLMTEEDWAQLPQGKRI